MEELKMRAILKSGRITKVGELFVMEIVVGDGTLVEVGWLVCSRCSWWGFRPNRPGDRSQFSQHHL